MFFEGKKNEKEKKLLLIATDKSSFINKTELTLKIFSDSTYVFNVNVNGQLYNKVENFKGYVKIKNDSLDFFPSRFEMKIFVCLIYSASNYSFGHWIFYTFFTCCFTTAALLRIFRQHHCFEH